MDKIQTVRIDIVAYSAETHEIEFAGDTFEQHDRVYHRVGSFNLTGEDQAQHLSHFLVDMEVKLFEMCELIDEERREIPNGEAGGNRTTAAINEGEQ